MNNDTRHLKQNITLSLFKKLPKKQLYRSAGKYLSVTKCYSKQIKNIKHSQHSIPFTHKQI